MLRQFLTLLALITGLAATAAPAEAHYAHAVERVEMAAAQDSVAHHFQLIERFELPRARPAVAPDGRNGYVSAMPQIDAARVIIGVDRARE